MIDPVSAARPVLPAAPARAPAAPLPEAPQAAPAEVTTQMNPHLRLDHQLGLVVIEFRDEQGKVENSIPTPREIDAYRAAALAGEAPPAQTPALQQPPAIQGPAAETAAPPPTPPPTGLTL